MIENHVRTATCQIICGTELGTGFLVTENLILTARHCVLEAIENNVAIDLNFSLSNSEIKITATVINHDTDLDICLLSIPNSLEITPIKLEASLPREGGNWYSFGYPASKSIGHRVSGNISQILEILKLRMDLDLTIESSTALGNYSGLSGSAMICEGAARGLIKLKLQGTLGSISIHQLTDFLTENKVPVNQKAEVENLEESSNIFAERAGFKNEFEVLLKNNSGKYIFLEGAHGIGKTTFCNEFNPDNSSLLVLGNYSFSSQKRGISAAQQIQPDVLFDWISTSISILLSGEPSRKVEKPYSGLIVEVEQLLKDFSEYCISKNSQGIIFIDGLNEAESVGKESFSRLMGLLPLELPIGISVVFTAPSYDNIKVPLEGRVNESNIIALPSLGNDIVKNYCWQEIQEDRATPALISHICEKSQGHPLYLRYLIEYVNNEPADNELDDFPVFTGSIGTYYEQLWSKLLEDREAANLLAIISRLRWGISTNDLPKILTPTEQAVFISTLSRIRHLLLTPDETSIYHASFTDFLISKTSQLDNTIEKRLAEFCANETELIYCNINIIYHLLRSGNSESVTSCTQKWVDQCVTLGVEPDTLLFDIEEVLAFAVTNGSTVEIVRILLLSQRINFRYNTLFAQSAQLAAKALIALKRPQDALQHAIRFNTLFVHLDEAFQIILSLIQGKYIEEALELLALLEDQIIEALGAQTPTFEDFIFFRQVQIRCLLFMELADGNDRLEKALNTLLSSIHILRENTDNSSHEFLQCMVTELQCVIPSHLLCFYDRYTNLDTIRQKSPELPLPSNVLDILICSLHQYLELLNEFKLPKTTNSLEEIFADIEELLSSGSTLDTQAANVAVDILIQLDAPSSILESLATLGGDTLPVQFNIKADNGVDIDDKKIYQEGHKCKVRAFLNTDMDFPTLSEWSETEWLQSLEQITQALFWCEGKARRGKVDNNAVLQSQILDYIQTSIFTSLNFSLAQRITWEDSYAIPEKVLPLLYEKLVELYIDCYPQEIASFLQHISNLISSQCGVYSEGFREILSVVLHQIITKEINPSVSDCVFDLLQQWKDYVLRNVENRYELVPELLKLIPLFVRMDADEIAKQLYQNMLDASMGPSWYKEDQFGIMISALKSIPKTDNVNAELPQIAGYLERSSGEMTFQRFIRYEKMELIGELFRRGKSNQGCQYFKRQVCGTLPELYSEASTGDMDRIDTMNGMRYPGGALDEQAAILHIIRNVEQADWRLCWVLLEIYQYGDTRHLTDYAEQYAILVNTVNEAPEVLLEMVDRMKFILGSELNPNQHLEFLKAFQDKLDSIHLPLFSGILEPILTESSTKKPERKTQTEGLSAVDDRDDDVLYLPGTFGKASATKDAYEVLAKAEKELARGNIDASKYQAVEALQTLQNGGWSIWGSAHRAEDILLEQAQSADEVIQRYAPLLLNERYEARWKLAEHLIGRVTKILDDKESNLLVQSAIDHIRLLVGDAKGEIEEFEFLGEEEESNASLDLLKLLFWLIDHPEKLRGGKAANMLSWLLKQETAYYEHCVSQAFSMGISYSADVICGIFDGLSTQNPLHFWEQVSPFLNLGMIPQNCQHVSRLTILHRIANRAADAGSTYASEIAALIVDQFHPDSIKRPSIHIPQPIWMHCLTKEWKSLESLGVISNEFVDHFEKRMLQICSPLDISSAWNLEERVSTGFKINTRAVLNRWEAKIRFALNTSLFHFVSKQNFLDIESTLRLYNPSLLILTQRAGFNSLGDTIIEAVSKKTDIKRIIGDRNTFFLNYQELVINKNTGELLSIEIKAVIISEFSGYQPNFLTDASLFSSRQLPNTDSKLQGYETCYSVNPDIAFLGTFTPAVPTNHFIKLISAKDSDFLCVNWSNGRYQPLGSPMSEGCLLSVKRNAVRLSRGWGLAWFIIIDGQVAGITKKIW